jgi:hypothetical protein
MAMYTHPKTTPSVHDPSLAPRSISPKENEASPGAVVPAAQRGVPAEWLSEAVVKRLRVIFSISDPELAPNIFLVLRRADAVADSCCAESLIAESSERRATIDWVNSDGVQCSPPPRGSPLCKAAIQLVDDRVDAVHADGVVVVPPPCVHRVVMLGLQHVRFDLCHDATTNVLTLNGRLNGVACELLRGTVRLLRDHDSGEGDDGAKIVALDIFGRALVPDADSGVDFPRQHERFLTNLGSGCGACSPCAQEPTTPCFPPDGADTTRRASAALVSSTVRSLGPDIDALLVDPGVVDALIGVVAHHLPDRGGRFAGDEPDIAMYITRSLNQNIVCYRAMYAVGLSAPPPSPRRLHRKDPLSAYWLDIDPAYVARNRMKGKMDDRCELNVVDRTMAYGVSVEHSVRTIRLSSGAVVEARPCRFVALKGCHMLLLVLPFVRPQRSHDERGDIPVLLCVVGGSLCVVERVYVHATRGKGFWSLPAVEYVDICGIDGLTGAPVAERIVP